MSEAIDEPITEEAVMRAEREGDDAEVIDGPDSPGIERSDADSAKMIAQAERANKAYTAKLRGIFGADTKMWDCPHCDGLGVTFAEQAEGEPMPEIVQAEDAEPCPKCNALGLTRTGSLQPGQETKPCGGCGGRGWREHVAAPVLVPPITLPSEAVAGPIGGQWVPGKGFVPYGSTEPVPGSLGA